MQSMVRLPPVAEVPLEKKKKKSYIYYFFGAQRTESKRLRGIWRRDELA